MIDFNNATFAKLKEIDTKKVDTHVLQLLLPNEVIISAYKGMRDSVVFTDKRVIAINVQGLTGTKIDYTSLPSFLTKKVSSFKNFVRYN